MLHCVFQASQDCFFIKDIPCYPYHEQITKPLIKDQFGRDARIRASQNCGKRLLLWDELLTALRRLMGMGMSAGNVTLVAIQNFLQCNFGIFEIH